MNRIARMIRWFASHSAVAFVCAVALAGSPAFADEPPTGVATYPAFSIGRVDAGLREFSRVVYGYKAEFLAGLADTVDGLGKIESPFARELGPVTAARLLALETAEVIALDTRSDYVEKSTLPPLQGSIRALRGKYRVESLRGIPASKETFKVALTSLSLAYKAVRPYVSSEADLRHVAEARKVSGISLARSQTGDFSCDEYLSFSEREDSSRFVEGLLQNPRTQGFGKLISILTGYLRDRRISGR